MNEEKLIKQIKKLEENLDMLETPCMIQDSDIVLADVMMSANHENTVLADIMMNANYEESGISKELFDIFEKTTDKNAFLELFHLLADTSFVDYLEKCEKALTKTLRQPHRKA